MSILTVEHLSHGFGDRAIFEDVSFRLLKGEHIGLVGANGEGKSTFMSIVTGKLQPDDGKVEWSPRVRVGYLDQHAVLTPGMTIQDGILVTSDGAWNAVGFFEDGTAMTDTPKLSITLTTEEGDEYPIYALNNVRTGEGIYLYTDAV